MGSQTSQLVGEEVVCQPTCRPLRSGDDCGGCHDGPDKDIHVDQAARRSELGFTWAPTRNVADAAQPSSASASRRGGVHEGQPEVPWTSGVRRPQHPWDAEQRHLSAAEALLCFASAHAALDHSARHQKDIQARALRLLEEKVGLNGAQVAGVLVDMAQRYTIVGKVERSKELLELALRVSERACGPGQPQAAGALEGLGYVHGRLGESWRQIELLERALPMVERHGGPHGYEAQRIGKATASAYVDLGNKHRQVELLEDTLDALEKQLGSDHPEVAGTLGRLAAAHADLGNAQKQHDVLHRCLKAMERAKGARHPDVAGVLERLGAACESLGRLREQRDYLERSLRIRELEQGPVHSDVAQTLVAKGRVCMRLGDARQACRCFERALDIVETDCGPEGPLYATVLANLSAAYGDLGDAAQQKEELERSLEIFRLSCASEQHVLLPAALRLGKESPPVELPDMSLSKPPGHPARPSPSPLPPLQGFPGSAQPSTVTPSSSAQRTGGEVAAFTPPPRRAVDKAVADSPSDVSAWLDQPTTPAAAEAPACPGCHRSMEWSSYDLGEYDLGWTCNNVERCRSRTSNSGPFRWFCQGCQSDLCAACHPRVRGVLQARRAAASPGARTFTRSQSPPQRAPEAELAASPSPAAAARLRAQHAVGTQAGARGAHGHEGPLETARLKGQSVAPSESSTSVRLSEGPASSGTRSRASHLPVVPRLKLPAWEHSPMKKVGTYNDEVGTYNDEDSSSRASSSTVGTAPSSTGGPSATSRLGAAFFSGLFPESTPDKDIDNLVRTGSGCMQAYVSGVRFSQAVVHPALATGLPLRQAAVRCAQEGWDPERPRPRAVLFLGADRPTLVCCDNRRLCLLVHLARVGRLTTADFDVYLAEYLVPDEIRLADEQLARAVFEAGARPEAVSGFLDRLGRGADGGLKSLRQEGVPEGFVSKTWGQMIFHRTFSQANRPGESGGFPPEGSFTSPVAAMDREAAYLAFCTRQGALGGRPPGRFDVQAHPSIFGRRTVQELADFLLRLAPEQLASRAPHLAEWCSQVYEANGFMVPPAWEQVLGAREMSFCVKAGRRLVNVRVEGGAALMLDFQGADDRTPQRLAAARKKPTEPATKPPSSARRPRDSSQPRLAVEEAEFLERHPRSSEGL